MTEIERIRRLERLVLFLVRNSGFDPKALVGDRRAQEDLAGTVSDLKREGALDNQDSGG
jgi:hypothetical protein